MAGSLKITETANRIGTLTMSKIKALSATCKSVAHSKFQAHKHTCLASMSVIVLVLHWVSPEAEAIGFAVVGVITSELA